MEILKINLKNYSSNLLQNLAKRIKNAEIGVIPTDTCYGLAANPNIKPVIENVYKIKNRDPEKQISCIFKDINQIKKWCDVTLLQEDILKANLPGAFTFILTPNKNYPLGGKTAGIRIPDFRFTKELSQELTIPYTATSANLAGQPSCYSVEEFLEQIKNHTFKPDYIVDAGILPQHEPSTVVDIRTPNTKILREGSGELK